MQIIIRLTSVVIIAGATGLSTPLSVHAAPKKDAIKLAPAKPKTETTTLPSPTQAPSVVPTPAATVVGPVGLSSQDFDLSKGPTNISADSLTLLTDKRTFTYQGKVVVVQGDMTLTSDFLDGNYSEKNEIEKIIARSNVTIVKGPDIKAGSQRAEYDAKARTIVLTEAPHIDQKGSVLTGDVIKVFVDENRSVAEGNVKVTLINTDDLKPPAPATTKSGGDSSTPTTGPTSSTPGAQ